MFQRRGYTVAGAGIALWVFARIVGSPILHVTAVGLLLLPFAAALLTRRPPGLEARRKVIPARVSAGETATVEIRFENQAASPTPLLLVEDALPRQLGGHARMALTGIPGHNSQLVTYQVQTTARGRHAIGPLRVDVSDPFGLTRRRITFAETEHLIVTPALEDLASVPPQPVGAGEGDPGAAWLSHAGEEFSTMREYHVGDDLRRIHWPSVAHTGELMIRQDEANRRSSATLFLDTRAPALGKPYTPPFERGVSTAASIGMLLLRAGYALRLAAGRVRPRVVDEGSLLEILSGVEGSPDDPIASVLDPLRTAASGGTTLVVATGLLHPNETVSLTRIGSMYGRKIVVQVMPAEPHELADELAARFSASRASLVRAGWDAYLISPSEGLRNVWQAGKDPRRVANAS
jgi:uncharacterized protein (DUF58 family)